MPTASELPATSPPTLAKRSTAIRWPIALALLLAAGPALTWAGAAVLAQRTRADIAALAPTAAPLLARTRADATTRAAWTPLLGRPSLGTVLERFAAALPPDDRLASVAADAGGTLEATVLTADPDALREALRHEPALSQLRETGQQRGDAAMRVTLRGALP